jgi:hypothetical protein
MATAKEHIAEIIMRQPDDSSYDDIVRLPLYDFGDVFFRCSHISLRSMG